MDRLKYCHELNRELFLQAMGYRLVSFAYDDVEQRPELCVQLLRMLIGRFQPQSAPVSRGLLAEKEIMRLAFRQAGSLRPKDVQEHYGINARTADHMLLNLVERGWLLPVKGRSGERTVRYELVRDAILYWD